MPDYVVSDTHFDHENIVDYCDRPFDDVEEMNAALVDRWNATVDEGEEVLFLGDFAPFADLGTFLRWFDELQGEVLFLPGDHDDVVPDRSEGLHLFERYSFEAGGHRFRCVHDPEDGPGNFDGWVLHGHHHDNWPDRFPLVNPGERLVNVSVELLDYRPLAVERLVELVDRGEAGEWVQSLADLEG
jgi:calcineurin-like phosphoesterase family protein